MATLVALLALTGCGSDGGTGADGPTREVVDAEGTTVDVPEDPERVVVLSEPTLDAALALNVIPVGTVSGRGQSGVPSYLSDVAGGIPIMGAVGQPNFEAIGAEDPDLILVDGTSVNNNPPVIEALREIAPVVFTGYAGGDWKDNLAYVAEALNLADEGEQIIADYQEKIDGAKAQLSQYADDTFSIVRWEGNSASLILKELPAGRALTDLGLKRPPVQDKEGRGHSEPVSIENLNQIDADHMFFGTLGGSSVNNPNAGGASGIDAAQQALTDAEATPGFASLNVYQNNGIILVEGSAWTSTGGPLLMYRIVDDVLEALA
ncbi:MAG: ABC transporter substrate-binding protein [Cumulibacter sp.]